MGKAEGRLLGEITEAAAQSFGMHLFRNTVGRAKMMGGWVTLGLAPGSPDLIGYWPIRVSDRTLALFVGVEAKTGKDCLSAEQISFHERLIKNGALVFTAYTVQEFVLQAQEAAQDLRTKGLLLLLK
jgi:hypothetical protein